MSDKATGPAGAAGTAPTADQPGKIRNVVLVGHSGAGKTTLVEALLVATGAIPRAGRVEDGTTTTDFEDAEVRHQRSVSLALAPVEHDGVKINLLDAPGYADFVGDLRAGLRAADAALFVMSAVDGIDGSTRMLWEECAQVGMPRAVVITKLDSPRADFDAVVGACQATFGIGVLPLYVPVAQGGAEAPMTGLLGTAERARSVTTAADTERCAPRRRRNSRPSVAPATRCSKGIIAESEDETLMDRYLAGEDIDVKIVIEDLEKAVARGSFYPVLGVCGTTGHRQRRAPRVACERIPVATRAPAAPGHAALRFEASRR